MFSSPFLAIKGPLRTIWVAAYFHTKLKKAQITQTDIVSAVDKMLEDDFGVVTYRVLAYLLLGVVRIQSRKIGYMFNDCQEVLTRINEFFSKKESSHSGTVCAHYYSITLPDRFELDAFELDILDDTSGSNVMPNEAITLKDSAWKSEGMMQFSLDKYQFEFNAASQDSCFLVDCPTEDVLSSHMMNNDEGTSLNLSNLEASLEKLRDIRFSQEECLNIEKFYGIEEDPPVLVETFNVDHHTDGEEIILGAQNHMEMSMDKLVDCVFSQEDCLNHEPHSGFCEKPPDLVKPFGKDNLSNEEQIQIPEVALLESAICQITEDDTNLSNLLASMEKLQDVTFSQEEFPRPEFSYRSEEEHPETVRHHDECNHHTNALQIKDTEMTSSEDMRCHISTEDQPLSVTLNGTPISKFADLSGCTTPNFMVLPTPTAREPTRKRKRKCIIDDPVVLSNMAIKKSIDNPSDLVSRRRKVPYSALAAWKAQKLSCLPESISEPLLSCPSVELRLLFCKKNLEIPESIEVVKTPEAFPESVETVEASAKIPESVEIVETPIQLNVPQSPPIGGFIEERQIAPETPIREIPSMRSVEPARKSFSINSDGVRPASLCEGTENDMTPCEDQEHDINLMNEEITSRYKDNREFDVSPGRTRIASILKQRTEKETVNLSQIVIGKTRKDSAKLFYEILVLKSRGYISVEQACAYGDIHIQRLLKWEQLYGAHQKL